MIYIIRTEDEPKFYTSKYDRCFKEIFLKEINQDLLIKLLETVLQTRVNFIDYKNIERNQGKIRRKNLDVLLNTNQGLIDIEVNSTHPPYLHIRNFAFTCDIYAHLILVGECYKDNIKVIQINFSYKMSKKDKEIVRKHYVCDKSNDLVKHFEITEFSYGQHNEILVF